MSEETKKWLLLLAIITIIAASLVSLSGQYFDRVQARFHDNVVKTLGGQK